MQEMLGSSSIPDGGLSVILNLLTQGDHHIKCNGGRPDINTGILLKWLRKARNGSLMQKAGK